MPTPRKTLVFGPAYLDRVLKVDRPLIDPAVGGVIDRSATGRLESEGIRGPESPDADDSAAIHVAGLASGDLQIELPPGWPGPTGLIWAFDGSEGRNPRVTRHVRGIAWHDDLGGMGAGYAKALGGTLCLRLGDEAVAINRRVVELLDAQGIDHRATRIPGRLGEWTLLITSGEYGDKLPIGFRDLSTAEIPPPAEPDGPCDLLVVASMTNKRAASALGRTEARVRLFAPAMRNMLDVDPKVSQFARHVDILCCNRGEWESLADREEVAFRLSILAVTDGPAGAEVRYTTPTGDAGRLQVPAFPRRRPPVDTNRAGEAFASTLVATLLDGGWEPGPASDDLIRVATTRASAASALVLDRSDFGFPTAAEIDRAVADGGV